MSAILSRLLMLSGSWPLIPMREDMPDDELEQILNSEVISDSPKFFD
jgi:hypothetical protein